MTEKLTQAEIKRLENYQQALNDVDGDKAVLSSAEWEDFNELKRRDGESCQ